MWATLSIAIGLGVLYKRRTAPIAISLYVVYFVIVAAVPFYTGLTLEEIGGHGVRWPERADVDPGPASDRQVASLAAPPQSDSNGGLQFFIDPALLKGVAENQRVARLTELLRSSTSNRRLTVTRVEPFLDSDGELQGYMAIARP